MRQDSCDIRARFGPVSGCRGDVLARCSGATQNEVVGDGARPHGEQARPALAVSHLCRAQLGPGQQRALPHQPRARADRPLGRVRPADPDRLRQRPPAGRRRGRQGRRADHLAQRHGDPVRRHPARADEHLDDHQRHRPLAALALHRGGPAAGRRRQEAAGHGPERHHQGISVARDLHLPAQALDAADHRRDRLHLRRAAEMEPDQRLQLPPAGGRGHAGAGAGLRAGDRRGRAGRDPRRRPGARGRFRQGGRPDQLLRQCRHPLRHRAVQDARLRRAVGRDLPRALRHRGGEVPPVPLRRAGQLAWA